MNNPKRLDSIIVFEDGTLTFKCASELYGTTDAGGKADISLKNGFVALGDGNDYILNNEEKEDIKKQLAAINKPKQSYYSKELTRLNQVERISFQFRDEKNSTKWMDLNKESIKDLKAFLDLYSSILQ